MIPTGNNESQWAALLDDIAKSTGVRSIVLGLSAQGVRTIIACCPGGNPDRARHSAFEVGCISNLLLSLSAERLRKDSRLQLDWPVHRLFDLPRGSGSFNEVTVQHLLQHCTGLASIGYLPESSSFSNRREQILRAVDASPRLFRAGSVVNYDTANGVVLAEVLARCAGVPARQLLVGRVAEIADIAGEVDFQRDMADGQVSQGYNGLLGRDEGPMRIRLRIHDLLSVGEHVCSGLSSSGNQWWGNASRTAELAIPRTLREQQDSQIPTGYGFGVARYANGLYGHDGATDEHAVSLRCDIQSGLVISMGLTGANGPRRNRVLTAVLAHLGLSPGRRRTCRHEFTLGEVVGHYVGQRDLEVRVESEGEAVDILVNLQEQGWFKIEGRLGSHDILTFQGLGAENWCPTFFRDLDTGGVCLMVGMHAYKRSHALGGAPQAASAAARRIAMDCVVT